jgi:hypothetical protein
LHPRRGFSGAVGANGTAFAVEKQYAFREIFSKGSKSKIESGQAAPLHTTAAMQRIPAEPGQRSPIIPALNWMGRRGLFFYA